MRFTIRALCQKRNELHEKILHCPSELSTKLRQKLDQLIGPQNNSDSWPESLKTAIRIPENLPLSDSEKSVLSKGLNFVPISEKSTNFQLSKNFKNSLVAFN